MLGLADEAAPQIHWEVFCGAAQHGNEVILEDLDCFFCNVAPVVVGRNKLVFCAV